jgi:hypothetical protein
MSHMADTAAELHYGRRLRVWHRSEHRGRVPSGTWNASTREGGNDGGAASGRAGILPRMILIGRVRNGTIKAAWNGKAH